MTKPEIIKSSLRLFELNQKPVKINKNFLHVCFTCDKGTNKRNSYIQCKFQPVGQAIKSKEKLMHVRFKVLTMVTIKITAFWHTTHSSSVVA
jgi:hypothetical protein